MSPLQALATLDPPAPVLHVYAQPEDPGYLAAQQAAGGRTPLVPGVEAGSAQPLPPVRSTRRDGHGYREICHRLIHARRA